MVILISNKKAWLRILEASIAIVMVVGVVLFFYSSSSFKTDSSKNIFDFQKNILDKISADYNLRQKVLDGNETSLSEFVQEEIPTGFNFSLRVCDLVDDKGELVPCNIENYIDADVYVEEKVISGDLDEYKLKKVRLFVWRV